MNNDFPNISSVTLSQIIRHIIPICPTIIFCPMLPLLLNTKITVCKVTQIGWSSVERINTRKGGRAQSIRPFYSKCTVLSFVELHQFDHGLFLSIARQFGSGPSTLK